MGLRDVFRVLSEFYEDFGERADFETVALLFTLGLLIIGFIFFQLFPAGKSLGNLLNVLWMLFWLPLLVKTSKRRVKKDEA